ncbi:MAG: hypothetical protein RLY43_209 [Bacteroidota bacterium]
MNKVTKIKETKKVSEYVGQIVIKKATIQARSEFRKIREKYDTVLSKKSLDSSMLKNMDMFDGIDLSNIESDQQLAFILMKTEKGREFLKSRILTEKEETEYEKATLELFEVILDSENSKLSFKEIISDSTINELWVFIDSFRQSANL